MVNFERIKKATASNTLKRLFLLAFLLIASTYIHQSESVLNIHRLKENIVSPFIRQSHILSDWLFLKATFSGKNGYDTQVLADECRLAGVDASVIARYNPPWYYLFFIPFVFLSASNFTIVLTLLSCLAAVYATEKAFQLFGRTTSSPLLIAATVVSFSPVISNLCFGQITNFLALALVLTFDNFARKRDARAGFWLALLSVKPQSTYLVPILIFALALRTKRYKLIVAYIFTFSFLIAVSFAVFPSLFYFWNQTPVDLEWATLTLATYVRLALLQITDELYYWPVLMIPAVTAVIVFLATLKKNQDLPIYFALLPCLSVITAPYGWFYDLAILIPTNCFILETALKQKQCHDYSLLSAWLLLNIAGVLGIIFFDYLSLWFFPLTIFFLGWRSVKLSRTGSPVRTDY